MEPFFDAFRHRDESVVHSLIAAGADVNGSDKEGKTALFYAVQLWNNESVVRALIAAGANVNITDNEGKTVLFYAVQEWINERVVCALIDARAGVNKTDNEGKTALFYAVQIWINERVVRALIGAGADVNRADNEGKTALFYAVQKNWINERVVRALIDASADVNRVDNERKTALFYAVQQNNNECVVRALIDAGADVNRTDNEGKTALMITVKFNSESVVRALIAAGADVSRTDNEGKNAFLYAVERGDSAIAQQLIDKEADVNIADKNSMKTLSRTLSFGNTSLAQLLVLKANPDFTRADDKGKTVLFYAVENTDNTMFVQGLIRLGADVNTTDRKGKTALFYVLQSNRQNMLDVLVENGADVNKADDSGKTALFYAEDEIVVHALIAAGTDVNITDNEGKTALFHAVHSDNESVVCALIAAGADVNRTDKERKTALQYAKLSKMGQTILFHAVHTHGNSELLIRTLVNAGLNINTTNSKGETVLINAVLNNREDVVSSLIDCGVNVDMTDNEGKTALINAFERGYENIARILINGNADVTITDSRGRSLLFYSITLSLELTRELVQKGCVLKEECHVKVLTALIDKSLFKTHEAQAYINERLQLLKEQGIERKTIKKTILQVVFCRAPLYLAYLLNGNDVETDSFEEAMKLAKTYTPFHEKLKLSKILKEVDKMKGWKSNERAITLGVLDILTKLKEVIADPNTVDSDGNTALHHATQLAFYGVSEEYVLKICQKLQKLEVSPDIKNYKDETPLLFCLSRTKEKISREERLWPGFTTQRAVCEFLVLDLNAKIKEKTANKETVMHLTLKLYQEGFLKHDTSMRRSVTDGCRQLLKVFLHEYEERRFSINSKDNDQNTPLHLWSSLKLSLNRQYSIQTVRGYTFKELLKEIFDKILQNPAELHIENKNRETPLHLCRTWAAVELLLDAGANPDAMDSSGRSPLLSAAINKTFLEKSGSFYPDISDQPTEFWKTAFQKGLNPYTVDGQGKSVLSILIESEAYDLSNALIQVAKGTIDPNEIQFRIRLWNSVSKRHFEKLSKVARRQESKHVESFSYHKDHLASGSFGAVFAGINEKDGREVAIKRIEKRHMQRPEDKREISNLTALADCEQVVRYLSFFEDEDFSYVVLELMEGNLEEYLSSPFDVQESFKLGQDIVQGFNFLHSYPILHRDLKPTNILYKLHPKLCLKIADFGLSLRINSTGSTIGSTVFGTNAGTRGWIAPEVLRSTKNHSTLSDMFACGLVLHYMLSGKKHPFAPKEGKGDEVIIKTESNIIFGNMEGWDNSLRTDASHLLKALLERDVRERPAAAKALRHPLFWTKKKRMYFLLAVGNQPEFEYSRSGKLTVLTAIESDLETNFGTIVKYDRWNDPGYVHMPAIYNEMKKHRKYKTNSVVELVRFVRNAIAHVSESTRPTSMRKQVLEDFVFLEYFPNLVMEVYKAVTTHGWDQTREEIHYSVYG